MLTALQMQEEMMVNSRTTFQWSVIGKLLGDANPARCELAWLIGKSCAYAVAHSRAGRFLADIPVVAFRLASSVTLTHWSILVASASFCSTSVPSGPTKP